METINHVMIFCEDGRFYPGSVAFGERVEEFSFDDRRKFRYDDFLIPGLVEIHSHGALGCDYSDGDVDGIKKLAAYNLACGVTSFLATMITGPKNEMLRALKNAGSFVEQRPDSGARLIGINAEGPFLSSEKRGAHREDCLLTPDVRFFDEMWQAADGAIRLLSLAPELDGALPFIDYAQTAAPDCHVSVAHTAADYDTARAAYDAGATHLTHLFNAMPPFLHRAPGPIGAAMDTRAYTEVIADGFHLHPSVVQAAFRMFPGRVCLISDSIRSAGLPDGAYVSGGQRVFLKDGKALLADGTIAGSSISLLDGLKNAVRFGVPLQDAVAAATCNPARAIGRAPEYDDFRVIIEGDDFGSKNDVGVIRKGVRADMLLLDKDLNLKKVIIDGLASGTQL